MDENHMQSHRQHFTLSDGAKQMLEVLTSQRYPGKQRRQSQLIENLITEAFTKEQQMTNVATPMHEPEPEDLLFKEIRFHLLEIETHLLHLAQSPTEHVAQLTADTPDVIHVYRHFHTIAGVSSMMGFPAIAQICYEMEEHMEGIVNGRTRLTENILRLLQDGLAHLWDIVNGRGRDANEPALIEQERKSSFSDTATPSLAVSLSCPTCTRSIQADWKHCVYCGTSLALVCSQCGAVQPHLENIRFCYECGNQLA